MEKAKALVEVGSDLNENCRKEKSALDCTMEAQHENMIDLSRNNFQSNERASADLLSTDTVGRQVITALQTIGQCKR